MTCPTKHCSRPLTAYAPYVAPASSKRLSASVGQMQTRTCGTKTPILSNEAVLFYEHDNVEVLYAERGPYSLYRG
jgi:hypothetical protein